METTFQELSFICKTLQAKYDVRNLTAARLMELNKNWFTDSNEINTMHIKVDQGETFTWDKDKLNPRIIEIKVPCKVKTAMNTFKYAHTLNKGEEEFQKNQRIEKLTEIMTNLTRIQENQTKIKEIQEELQNITKPNYDIGDNLKKNPNDDLMCIIIFLFLREYSQEFKMGFTIKLWTKDNYRGV